MGRFNYNNRERRWRLYHKLEAKQKEHFLKKMSEEDSFKILKELHQFAYKSGAGSRFNKLDMAKVETLAKVHSMFGKIEA